MQLNEEDINDNKWNYVEKKTKHSPPSLNCYKETFPQNILSPNDSLEHRFFGFTVDSQNNPLSNACGYKYAILKGSKKEHQLWSVKDSYQRSGKHYYFDSPDQAEMILRIQYDLKYKKEWYLKNKIGHL